MKLNRIYMTRMVIRFWKIILAYVIQNGSSLPELTVIYEILSVFEPIPFRIIVIASELKHATSIQLSTRLRTKR